ncbi:hypothetical protein FEM48_Zijuj07G0098800 [Ziziphus jujuba var. spinosa]|uniref:Large ribosomal subunit protein eL14 domain-containing protein n=1 Tax=Ziziphus jujuba var. spinosa TaxID=714518 RepID=A0A978V3Y8_ZIZJJ|nr:hypothetical protein FEM48_Zijuj07G0098800 [Ziziphus jujuba var. spinosa]
MELQCLEPLDCIITGGDIVKTTVGGEIRRNRREDGIKIVAVGTVGIESTSIGAKLCGCARPFKRYVEIGRVALVNYGNDYGKLVVIVDVIDQNRALVDAPDMVRSQMNFKRLSLTDIKIDIKRVPKKKELLAAMEAADVKKKWENSSWGRKFIVQKRRACLTDFDRFKLMLAKIKRAGLVRQELANLKKNAA